MMNFKQRISFFESLKKFLVTLIDKYNLRKSTDLFIAIDSKLSLLKDIAELNDEARFRHNSGELGQFLERAVCQAFDDIFKNTCLTAHTGDYQRHFARILAQHSPTKETTKPADIDRALADLLKSMENLRENTSKWPLPYDLTNLVFSFLDPKTKSIASMICKLWNKTPKFTEFDLFMKYTNASKIYHSLIAPRNNMRAFFDLDYSLNANNEIQSSLASNFNDRDAKTADYFDRGLKRLQEKLKLVWEIQRLKDEKGEDKFRIVIKKFNPTGIKQLLAELNREIKQLQDKKAISISAPNMRR